MGIRYAGQVEPRRQRYWYAGTDVLLPGYTMCLDVAAPAGSLKTSLGKVITKPATANLACFVGFVAEKKTGPCFVDVVEPSPGAAYQAFTDANMTAGVTALAPQNGSYALAAFADATLNLPLCAVALETVDTDTNNANKWVLMK